MNVVADMLVVVGLLAIVGLVPLVILRARALDRRIREHLAEEESGPKDPYAQMAALMMLPEEKRTWPKD